jgi:hypothetical protein
MTIELSTLDFVSAIDLTDDGKNLVRLRQTGNSKLVNQMRN